MRNIVVVFLLATVLVSCHDEGFDIDKKKTSKTMSLKDYRDLIMSSSDDRILMQSSSSLNDSHKVRFINSASNTSAAPLSFSVNGKTYESIQVDKNNPGNGWRIESTNAGELYGQKVKMQLTRKDPGSSVARTLSEEAEFYIPAELNAQVTGLVNDQVVAGTRFSWNADADNLNGVLLAVEYDYSHQRDPKIIEEIRKKVAAQAGGRVTSETGNHVSFGITTNDTGSYQVSEKDLSFFPENTYLSFYIIRLGHTTVMNEKNQETTIAAYTSLRADFRIGK